MTDLAQQPETGTGGLELDLLRRLVAEALGTGLLVIAVIGSGIMASRLSPHDVGLELLENAAATAAALIGLILMFGAISGAHFNPAVTLVDRAFGSITARDTGLYIVAQILGGCVGAMLANLMFELSAVELSTKVRSSPALWLSEIIATAGLLLVIHGCVRTGRANVVAFAVGIWIGGAYWFTSSTSFANPAVTIARTLSNTFAGIAPSSAPMFIVMQLIGAAIAYGLIRLLYPNPSPPSHETAKGHAMPSVDDLSTAQQHLIHTAAARLEDKFRGVFGAETIERYINDSLDQLLPNSQVTSFVPIFVERFARDRLRALAKIEGKVITDKPSVMFLCVHNAGRSQMAAGWLKHLAGDRVDVFSGGSEPASVVNPAAIEAMAEVGIDIRTEFPKPWTDEVVRAADVVVTMGCGDACPVYPGKRYEDWVLDDPEGVDLEGVRPIRDEIRGRVENLIAELEMTPAS
jgi:arsenate reductase